VREAYDDENINKLNRQTCNNLFSVKTKKTEILVYKSKAVKNKEILEKIMREINRYTQKQKMQITHTYTYVHVRVRQQKQHDKKSKPIRVCMCVAGSVAVRLHICTSSMHR